ncbi:efflux RND transporter periplasmic adaptor subunit [Rhodoplanes sp. TEM]|uniref:Efflux RND transporter periplasmic adaptor subunit n=1 Tax=Rhodoplanes tepidamans TaxID=200616 RepID=A0ABT5J6H9_RHOTP|nr:MULTISPECIES: efflux RND transporter periplasmic adaptor subunit [Rhodoplanes]MDC7785267.1 efflux RND transporter periplasmic adaptor subunit [Rhodoplanes tepidamans]MDC7984666.1 efflux RND transporter periplasmic adaptor subunit [Rhodoplanes sp. TEM]MDQ0353525.1 membrane fusion protein (multidrug efflux system) [Rhodoplanes tepidamans]
MVFTPHKKSAAPALAAALLAASLLAACGQENGKGGAMGAPGPGGAMPAPEVGVLVLHPKSVAVTTELPGRTTAFLTAEVRPQVNGIIKQRLFVEGSEIAAGALLYQIDPATYQASYDSAVAALQKAEAAVPSAQAKVERYKGLSKEKAVSQQDLDDAVATLAQNKAAVASGKADLDTARINLAYTEIKAPIAGRIGKSSITVGALVTANQTDALATIRQIDPIYVDLTQSSLNFLKFRRALAEGRLANRGDAVPVRLILEDGRPYPHPGKLGFAEIKVDESTGTFTLRAEFPNPERLLLPGMYVRAVLEEGIAPGSFLVPQRAVSRNVKGEAVALFVGQNDTVEQRVLQIRRGIGSNWLVDSGLADGDRIVIEGSQKARAGQPVRPVAVTLDESTGEVKRADAAPAGAPNGAGPAGRRADSGAAPNRTE